MNIQQLAKEISREFGYPKEESKRVIAFMLHTIRQTLKRRERVKLKGFGMFEARKSHGKVRAKFDDSKHFFK